jgi:translation initiation factor 1A
MLGANRIVVQCVDGVTRMCRIPGKIKKRVWIREGDTVIVVPWEFQTEKADVIWRYTGPQAD